MLKAWNEDNKVEYTFKHPGDRNSRETQKLFHIALCGMDLSIHLLSGSDQILTHLNSLAECTRTTKLLLSIACLNLFLCTVRAVS